MSVCDFGQAIWYFGMVVIGSAHLTLLGFPLGVLLRRKRIAIHAHGLSALGLLRQDAPNRRVGGRHGGEMCALEKRPLKRAFDRSYIQSA